MSPAQQTRDTQHYAFRTCADQHGLPIDPGSTETSRGAKADAERGWGQLLPQLHAQATLLVADIRRLGRRLIAMVPRGSLLRDPQVTVLSVKEGLDRGATLHAQVFALACGLAVAIARSLSAARPREALARRRGAGQRGGRPPGTLSPQTHLRGRAAEIRML